MTDESAVDCLHGQKLTGAAKGAQGHEDRTTDGSAGQAPPQLEIFLQLETE